jgi:uncharacterized protein YidB (DUF937 family)
MSVMDQIRSMFSGSDNPPAGASGQMVEQVAAMMGGSGGLAALLQKFRNAGCGSAVDSWVGTGANQPISPEHVERALGGDAIQSIAAKLGLNPQQASTGLAALLPHMVDKLTPNGAVPEPSMLQQALSAFKTKWTN